jgi:hypothetical protein
LTIHTHQSTLHLPVRPIRDDAPITFPSPEAALPLNTSRIAPPEHSWRVSYDMETDESLLSVIEDSGTTHLIDTDWTISSRRTETYRVRAGDIHSARGETRGTRRFQRDSWSAIVDTHTLMWADAEHFHIQATLRADEGLTRFFERETTVAIPRDHV